jgi:protein involved in polysaccharide export with SLBB domain
VDASGRDHSLAPRHQIIRWIACSSLFLIIATSHAIAQTAPQPRGIEIAIPTGTPEYTLGPGDEIAVSFPYNAELNHDGPIGPDGRFTLPLVGNLELGGKTISQATQIITNTLRDQGIVANAYTSLTIRKYGVAVYVGGEVRQPGVIQLVSGMDALQAVIVAGGMLESAKSGHVAVIRRGPDNAAKVVYLDLHGYTKGKPNATTALLEPRDVIFVPRSSIAEVDRFVDDYLNRAVPFSKGLNYQFGSLSSTAAASGTTTTVTK